MKKYIFLIVSLLIFKVTFADIPERRDALVNDFAGVFSASQTQDMQKRLDTLSNTTGNQILVVIVTTLDGYEISDYALQLGRKWGVGQKDKNNGLVIVVKVKNETKGQAFIATGYGLEGALPDATCKHIVDREMIPHFKNNDYYAGVNAALDVVIPIMKGEYTSEEYEKSNDEGFVGITIFFIIFGIVVLLVVLDKSGRLGSGGGTTYSSGGTHTGPVFWGGGFGGSSWGGSSGSSFGGFGGGSFGGGGAGGSW